MRVRMSCTRMRMKFVAICRLRVSIGEQNDRKRRRTTHKGLASTQRAFHLSIYSTPDQQRAAHTRTQTNTHTNTVAMPRHESATNAYVFLPSSLLPSLPSLPPFFPPPLTNIYIHMHMHIHIHTSCVPKCRCRRRHQNMDQANIYLS
jgi:hypothetical protein